jgi:CRISPR system Cascade subunit CasA
LYGNGRIERADAVPAKASRIEAKALKGNVGDAWMPIDQNKEAALTPGPAGLTPELLRRLLFADQIQLTPLQRPLPDRSGPIWFTISVLVRGQGTTEGFHSEAIRIPSQARRRLFGNAQERDMLAELGKTGINDAGVMQNRVLKPALFSYAEGAPEQLKFDRDAVTGWWEIVARRFTDLWRDAYFPWLWEAAEHGDEAVARRTWTEILRQHAVLELRHTMDEWPAHTGRYYRVRTRAESLFYGALYRQFPLLRESFNVAIS